MKVFSLSRVTVPCSCPVIGAGCSARLGCASTVSRSAWCGTGRGQGSASIWGGCFEGVAVLIANDSVVADVDEVMGGSGTVGGVTAGTAGGSSPTRSADTLLFELFGAGVASVGIGTGGQTVVIRSISNAEGLPSAPFGETSCFVPRGRSARRFDRIERSKSSDTGSKSRRTLLIAGDVTIFVKPCRGEVPKQSSGGELHLQTHPANRAGNV